MEFQLALVFSYFSVLWKVQKRIIACLKKINAYVHLISLFASAVLIAIYNIEPYRKGYTRAAGVYAIFAVVVTVITLLIGMAQNGNDADNSDGN